MVTFPNAKINLGLNVIEKRADGYHNIETVFFPIGWCDVLEAVQGEKKINRKSDIQFKKTGEKIIGSSKKNLCVKVYDLLKERFDLPPVQMHLHKFIPVGSGLGGGSSDSAFTLMLMNKIFNLEIPEDELEKIASSIGADCAFFIRNKPVFASGIGDRFEDVNINLEDYFLAVVKPDIHVSTETAYKNITPKRPQVSPKEAIKKPVGEWKDLLVNDFESLIFKKYPVIKHIKEELYSSGAVYASMSGSGSAVYGLFSEKMDLKKRFGEYKLWSGRMKISKN